MKGDARFRVLGVCQFHIGGLRHELVGAGRDRRDRAIFSAQDRQAVDRVNNGARRVPIIHLRTARRVGDGGSAGSPDQRRIRDCFRIPSLNDVVRSSDRNRLKIHRGRDDQPTFHIAAEVIDNANLLHVCREIIVDRVEAFLKRGR